MENHDSGADQCWSIQRKARQQGWTESDNRQGQGRGSTALRESEQTGHNRAGRTNGIRSDLADWRALPEEAREKNISRQPGEWERTAPAHHRQTRRPASSVPKGARHNRRERQRKRRGQPQKGEGRETPFHRRNETGGRPVQRGARYYLVLVEMRGGEGALFSTMGTKKIFAFRYALHEKMKESTKAYTEICYYCSMEINKSGAC